MTDKLVEFLRKKDFVLKQELGQGACGRTVLLYDTVIDENFVCKKYSPFYEGHREELFKNFIREIKLLHLVNHSNVVRVFNYYLYPEQLLGYILMEYVKGMDIEDYLLGSPEQVNEIFMQVVEGFCHLEESNIIHRDIRPQNIMVTDNGIVKIIDFGFGKQVALLENFDKSITLNWWCEPPKEFQESVYNFQTEVYFVGKLFEKIIMGWGIEEFRYKSLLVRMCISDPKTRISSFAAVRKEMLVEKFSDVYFEERELRAYRTFSNHLSKSVAKIENGTKYYNEIDDIQSRLEDCFKKVMLEESLPNGLPVLSCFINGSYSYVSSYSFPVATLKTFIDLLRASTSDKKSIVLGNIQTRLDTVTRYHKEPALDDDIPF